MIILSTFDHELIRCESILLARARRDQRETDELQQIINCKSSKRKREMKELLIWTQTSESIISITHILSNHLANDMNKMSNRKMEKIIII